MNQRGIVLATFGSIYGDAVEASVGAMERRIAEMYPGIEVRRVEWCRRRFGEKRCDRIIHPTICASMGPMLCTNAKRSDERCA